MNVLDGMRPPLSLHDTEEEVSYRSRVTFFSLLPETWRLRMGHLIYWKRIL